MLHENSLRYSAQKNHARFPVYQQAHGPNAPLLRPHHGAVQGAGGTGSVAREIVRLSQEPAYKDRKWSLPADTRVARGPRGRGISAWRPDRSDSLPETSERGGVVIREALKGT